jgi:hypothetical protein
VDGAKGHIRGHTRGNVPGSGSYSRLASRCPDLLGSELQAAAALVFAQAMPGSVEPGPDESRSYAKWLCRRAAADRGDMTAADHIEAVELAL